MAATTQAEPSVLYIINTYAGDMHKNIIKKYGVKSLIYILSVLLTISTIYYAYTQPFVRVRFSNIFLGTSLCIFYLHKSIDIDMTASADSISNPNKNPENATNSVKTSGIYDYAPNKIKYLYNQLQLFKNTQISSILRHRYILILLAGVSIILAGYVEANMERYMYKAAVVGYTRADIIVGTLIIALVLDATRRAYGLVIPGVVLTSILYAYAGPIFPGPLQHSGMSPSEIVRTATVSLNGVYGFILGIGSTWVAIFIMFAGIAKSFGALEYIIDSSIEIRKKLETGIAQPAILSSLFLGSIAASAAANSATTGSFTIPMLKDQGINKKYSAAIEALASSGGQLMPPVMGIAAFLMADITGIPYSEIIAAATIPAVIFYIAVGLAVNILVRKFGWTAKQEGSIDGKVLMSGVYFLIPLGVIIYTLGIIGLSPLSSGLYGILSLILTKFVVSLLISKSKHSIINNIRNSIDGFKQGALDMAPLIGILASVGIIIAILGQTGLSQRVSTLLVAQGGGDLVLLLIIAAVASILFGLGMPTPAAYVMVAVLVAPALVEAGTNLFGAHLFVFYFAMLSSITPPVAVAVIITARIAGTSFFRAAIATIRLAAPTFVIPFAFIFHPSLLYWSFPETIVAVFLLIIGVSGISIAIFGYNLYSELSYLESGANAVLAFSAMFASAPISYICGIAIIALVIKHRAGLSAVSAVKSQFRRVL